MSDPFEIRMGTTSPAFRYDLPEGSGLNLEEAKRVDFVMPPHVDNQAIVVGPRTVEYQWQEGDTSVLGTFPAWIRITEQSDKVEIIPSGSVIPVRVW